MMSLTSPETIVNTMSRTSAWSRHLRSSLARFATGVAIVTVDGVDGPLGGVVRSFASVSDEPPLVMVSVDKASRVHDALVEQPFAVNILGADDRRLTVDFSLPSTMSPDWVHGDYAPRVRGVLAHVECTPWAAHDSGDRTLFVGLVEDFDYRSGDALGLVADRYVVLPEQLFDSAGRN